MSQPSSSKKDFPFLNIFHTTYSNVNDKLRLTRLTIVLNLNVHQDNEKKTKSGPWSAWEMDVLKAFVRLWRNARPVCWIHVSKVLSRSRHSCYTKARILQLLPKGRRGRSSRKNESGCACVECTVSHDQSVRAKRKSLISRGLCNLQSDMPFLQSNKATQINQAIEMTSTIVMDMIRRNNTSLNLSEFEVELRHLTNEPIKLTSTGITTRLRNLSGMSCAYESQMNCTCEGVMHIANALRLAEKRKRNVGVNARRIYPIMHEISNSSSTSCDDDEERDDDDVEEMEVKVVEVWDGYEGEGEEEEEEEEEEDEEEEEKQSYIVALPAEDVTTTTIAIEIKVQGERTENDDESVDECTEDDDQSGNECTEDDDESVNERTEDDDESLNECTEDKEEVYIARATNITNLQYEYTDSEEDLSPSSEDDGDLDSDETV